MLHFRYMCVSNIVQADSVLRMQYRFIITSYPMFKQCCYGKCSMVLSYRGSEVSRSTCMCVKQKYIFSFLM